jgi:hypothetical protein
LRSLRAKLEARTPMVEMTPASGNNPSQSQSKETKESTRTDQAMQSLKSTVSAGAHDLTDGAKHLAGDIVDQTKKSASSQIDLSKSRALEGLGTVASALRKTGEALRAENNDMLTGVIDSAAQRVDSASGYLKDKSFGDIVVDVKDFARREPALFLGGALFVGLVGGRFLKSSTPASETARSGGVGGSNRSTGARSTQGSRSSTGSHASRDNENEQSSSRHTPGAQSNKASSSSSSGHRKDESGSAKVASSTGKPENSTAAPGGSVTGSSTQSTGKK